MIAKMKINKKSRVLEIGTGYGYQTSLLSKIAREVFTVEVFESLSYASSKNFQKLNIRNIKQKNDDGFFGWKEESPFDAIIVSCCPSKIPIDLINQLANTGKLIIPLGKANNQKLHIITKIQEGYEEEISLSVRFVPMIDKSGSKY
jgi:protein-L-isoaspartate(D-aspartate) O-methyltransferase